MTPEIINVLIQIPLVGAFIWFTLRLSDIHQKERTARDAAWQAWLTDQNMQMREFLAEQRSASNGALARLAEEIKSNTTHTAELTGVITRHDERMTTRLAIEKEGA